MYTREVFQNAKEALEERRKAAESAAEARRAALYAKNDKIAKIDEELSGTGFLIFKAAIAGRGIDLIKARNEELMAERLKELTLLGLSEDHTEPKYTCQVCSDTGYDEDGHMCECMKELIRLENIKASGIGKLIEKQSFDNFDLEWYGKDTDARKKMEKIYKKLFKFANEFNKDSAKTFLLMGTTGTGKTHLSTAVAKTVIEKGFSVIYDSVQNIISDFETDKFKSGYTQQESRADKHLSTDLLIVDDLGTEFSSQFTLSCIYNIINTRQNRGLATIISTNLSQAELSKKYEARILSRLMGSDAEVLPFDGQDHRIKAPKSK